MNDNEQRGGKIVVHIDGSCQGNPGPGGWAAELQRHDDDGKPAGSEITLSGGAEQTTNNRQEMTAAIEALKATPEGASVEVISDSQILVNGMNEWVPGWQANGWRKSGKKKEPVANVDLWKPLVELAATRSVTWRWVRGHSGHAGNERVDALAQAEARKFANLLTAVA